MKGSVDFGEQERERGGGGGGRERERGGREGEREIDGEGEEANYLQLHASDHASLRNDEGAFITLEMQ